MLITYLSRDYKEHVRGSWFAWMPGDLLRTMGIRSLGVEVGSYLEKRRRELQGKLGQAGPSTLKEPVKSPSPSCPLNIPFDLEPRPIKIALT